jgi:predicted transposase YdaD
MPKPFDATMRKLIELEPAAWLRFLHIPISDPDRVKVIDSNISTVTAETDKMLWVDDPAPWIEQIELQAARDLGLEDRLHLYSTLVGYSRKVPVNTTIVLLRPAADSPDLSGTFEKRNRHGDVYDWFRYNVVRIWQRPVAEVLAAGLTVLPLAPVSDVGPEQVPEVLLAISERLNHETGPDQAATIWAATRVLMGLRFSREQVDEFTRGISAMILGIRGIEESSVYQDIFAKGEAKGEARGETIGEARGEARGLAKGEARGLAEGEARGLAKGALEALLRVGRRKLGEPTIESRTTLDAIDSVDRLRSLLDRVLDVSTWDELLAP